MFTFGSLFAGIGGFDLGLERTGMTCKWQVEIDQKCRQLLNIRWPRVEKWTDVRDVGKEQLAPVDLVCGGFPCQDLSVAGKRAGLAGERSGLWQEFHRVIAELRPRWVVIENVPGLLSSNDGRDMGTIVGALAQLRYGYAWAVLDAQYYGVARRRRRVFIVGCLGDWRGAAEVLFESESLSWDTAPRRETGQGVAALTKSGVGTCGADDNQAQAGHIVAIRNSGRDSDMRPGRTGTTTQDDIMFSLQAEQQHAIAFKWWASHASGNLGLTENITPPLETVHPPALTLPSKTQCVAFDWQAGGGGNDKSFKNKSRSYIVRKGEYAQIRKNAVDAIAFITKEDGRDATLNMTPTLRAENSDPHSTGRLAVAFAERSRGDGRNLETQEELAYALTDPGSGGGTHSRRIAGTFGIRRLTPTECERLQGFPDGWTAGQSDSARYRQLGNAVCVPVAEWIGRRIVEYEQSAG